MKEYDNLMQELANVVGEDMGKAKELSKQLDEVIKKMSSKEIDELLKRPYSSQYKARIKEIRGE